MSLNRSATWELSRGNIYPLLTILNIFDNNFDQFLRGPFEVRIVTLPDFYSLVYIHRFVWLVYHWFSTIPAYNGKVLKKFADSKFTPFNSFFFGRISGKCYLISGQIPYIKKRPDGYPVQPYKKIYS